MASKGGTTMKHRDVEDHSLMTTNDLASEHSLTYCMAMKYRLVSDQSLTNMSHMASRHSWKSKNSMLVKYRTASKHNFVRKSDRTGEDSLRLKDDVRMNHHEASRHMATRNLAAEASKHSLAAVVVSGLAGAGTRERRPIEDRLERECHLDRQQLGSGHRPSRLQ